MRTFFKHAVGVIAFFAILVSLLVGLSKVLEPKDNRPEAGMQHPEANGIRSEPKESIDVLILGDSETYTSMMPVRIWEQYGITSYCCGTPGQKLSYAEEFLHNAFETQSPKIVILETNAIFRKIPFDASFLHKMEMCFPVFEYHNRWKTMAIKDLSLSINYTYVDNFKGYKFNKKVAAASTEGYMKKSDGYTPIQSRNEAYVENFKSFCDEKGAKLILVSTPSTVNWNMKRHNSIQRLAEKLDIDYVDMNLEQDIIQIDWTKDTRDKGDHMNYFGAEKVTAYLGQYLEKTGLLANHMNDKNYQSWNEAAEKFEKQIEASLQ